MHKLVVAYDTPTDPEAFDAEYRERHVPLVHAVPGVERFTMTHPQALGGGQAPYLVAEVWFADEATMTAALRSDEMGAAAEHAATLPARSTMSTGEVVEA